MKISNEDRLHKGLKERLDTFEFPYSESDWLQLEKKLPKKAIKPFNAGRIITGTIAVALISAIAWFGFIKSNNQRDETVHQKNLTEINPEHSVNHDIQIQNAQQAASSTVKTITPENDTQNSSHQLAHQEKPKKKPTQSRDVHPSTEKENFAEEDVLNSTNDEHKAAVVSLMPKAEFTVSLTNGCPPLMVQFTPIERSDSIFYLWKFSDGQISTQVSPQITFEEPGFYSAQLIVSYAMSGIENSNEEENLIEVYPAPNAAFSIENEQNLYRFVPEDKSLQSYMWHISDLEIPDVVYAEYRFVKSGIYPVQLTVSNEFQCFASHREQVEVIIEYPVYMANAFTPDGDGRNDYFGPDASKLFDLEYHFEIISRDGQVIFSTTDINEKWDGTIQKSSDKAPQGVYVWKISLKDRYGNTQNELGYVTLIRSFE